MGPTEAAAPGAQPGERYRFAGIVVDAAAHTLTRDGQPQALEPKAFAVLLTLLRHAGELVARDQLLDAVWGHRHVTPGVLTRAIAQLRTALDDDSQHPRYIQTQHALGYRFIGSLEAPLPPPAPVQDGAAITATEVAATAAVVLPPIDALPIAGPVAALPRWRRRGWLPWSIVALLGCGLLAVWAWQRWPVPAAQAPVRGSIAVMPFASLSSDPSDRYFAEGLAVEMHDALAGVAGLKVAAQPPLAGDAPNRPRDARAIGQLLGVATVLDASVRREGERVRISARLADTHDGFTLWSGSYDRQAADVFALQSEIADEVVRELIGHLPGARQALSRRLTPTRDLAAYDAYLKGLHALEQASGGNGGYEQAIVHFRQALVSDRGFARAQAGICRAEIARLESTRDTPAFQRAQTACQRAQQMDPGLREVSLAMGEYHRVRGEAKQALARFGEALQDSALRPDAYAGMARTLGQQGRAPEALRYFQQALALRPGDATLYRQLGHHYYQAGELEQAIAAFQQATTLNPADAQLWSSLGGLYLLKGDRVQAGRAFSLSLSIKPNAEALLNLGVMKYEAGEYEHAEDMFRRADALRPDDYMIWGNIGDALSADPANAARARQPYQRAVELARGYLQASPNDAYALALLAWYQANLGQTREARRLLAASEALRGQPGQIAFQSAQTLALLGDVDAARQRLARARAAGYSDAQIGTSPVLRPLLTPAGDTSNRGHSDTRQPAPRVPETGD